MRKFLRLGDGVSLTTVTLLVCSLVLFASVIAVFEPVSEPSWWSDLLRNPAKHAILIFWLLFMLRVLFEPSALSGKGTDDEDTRTGLGRTADAFWAVAGGMLLCLAIVVDKDAVGTVNQDIPAYIAVGLVVLSIALRWRDQRERRGFGRQSA